MFYAVQTFPHAYSRQTMSLEKEIAQPTAYIHQLFYSHNFYNISKAFILPITNMYVVFTSATTNLKLYPKYINTNFYINFSVDNETKYINYSIPTTLINCIFSMRSNDRKYKRRKKKKTVKPLGETSRTIKFLSS